MTTPFTDELNHWGPHAITGNGSNRLSLHDAQKYCRQLATTHYENFPIASILLPRSLHQHFYNIYAFCRWADDLGDEINSSEQSLELLEWWKGELSDCYSGTTRHPVFIALRPTIDKFQIPQEPFADLISAFEQDQRINEYQTFDQLLDYCRRSANPVGRLVLYLCQSHNEQNCRWSDSICTGLQLANFWQDVRRDFDIDRIYIPHEDREKFGYSREDLNQHITNTAFLELMEFEVSRARNYLNAGLPLIAQLPGRLQIDIELFARGGLKILDRIEGIGYRVWDKRPTVTKTDFIILSVSCFFRMIGRKFRLT